MELLENPASLHMEHGGYVEPPSHLTRKAMPPTGLAAELRSVPDYDYSLFRYSNVNTPLLFLLIAVAVITFCLTCWQGPLGIVTSINGIQNGIPRYYEVKGINTEGGLKKSLRNLRLANFAIGLLGLLIAVFAIRSRPAPGALKGLLLVAALFFFVLFVTATIAFAIGLKQHPRAYECDQYRYAIGSTVSEKPLFCDDRKQMSIATFTADFALAFSSLFLCFALVFTTTKKNWAWGPGKISIAKSIERPKISYPPPSPFTHLHETRRLYVWFLIFMTAATLIIAFVLVIQLTELKTDIIITDARNLDLGFYGSNSEFTIKSGWHRINNRFRLALTSLVAGFAVLQWLNMLSWKRRWLAYVLAVFMFWGIVGSMIIFGMDVHDINKARKLPCPNVPVWYQVVEPYQTRLFKPDGIRCSQWNYFATAFMEFLLGFLLILYVFIEFFYRAMFTWETYYFYADSEWLRNHSLFVESTDREAYDWKRFTMETGRDYYYSPTLGISTRTRPRNYIDPDVPAGFPAY